MNFTGCGELTNQFRGCAPHKSDGFTPIASREEGEIIRFTGRAGDRVAGEVGGDARVGASADIDQKRR